MYVQLPPILGKSLDFPHFPAPFQCVIFRNWGMVPVERIAGVIGCSAAQVIQSAAEMGLEYTEPDASWLSKGYITIIRANWFLLDYAGICRLLDWTEERLSFTLREDDFLEVKLGHFKPTAPDYRWRALTPDEQARTREIREIVAEFHAALPENCAAPFDFTPRYDAMPAFRPGTARFHERIVHSYCALYGDVFADRRLLDESFPDALLGAYSRLGITGIWTHIVLYQTAPFPFDPEVSRGWEARVAGMRYLSEKLEKYGIKLFLYFNEPRAMPEAFFEKYPDLRGAKMGDYSTLCIRHPEVQKYLSDGVRTICENVPGLGGFFTITASENLTNCHSHYRSEYLEPCPRCSGHSPAESYALVNRLVREAASSVSESIKVIAWSWGWEPEITPDVIRRLTGPVSVMNVSEQAVKKLIDGTETQVLDYSISVEGPGSYALDTWKTAHECGHGAFAKLQLNNTWEMSAAPFVPALEKVYRHLRRLAEAGGSRPDGLLLSWSLGGYPSPTLALVSAFCGDEIPALADIYAELFPKCDQALLAQAIHLFSEAFDAYPFHIGCAYNGPQQCAPANLLHAAPTGLSATMVGYPHDDLDSWRAIFPASTYISHVRKLSDMWNEGLSVLNKACAGDASPLTRELSECAAACGLHFRSMYLQCAYVCRRDDRDIAPDMPEIPAILAEEQRISLETARLQAVNPAIGYESSNHYFYHRNALIEKAINCRLLAKKYEGR